MICIASHRFLEAVHILRWYTGTSIRKKLTTWLE